MQIYMVELGTHVNSRSRERLLAELLYSMTTMEFVTWERGWPSTNILLLQVNLGPLAGSSVFYKSLIRCPKSIAEN